MFTCSGRELGNLESPVMTPIVHTEIGNFSTKERLKLCLKPRYQMRRLKTKGAILVLIWGFFLMSAYYFINYQSLILKKGSYFYIIQASMSLVMPFAGWLADVRFSRFRVIYWSLWTVWISSVLITANFIAKELLKESYKDVSDYPLIAFTAMLGVGYGGFQANIVQFGVDQLPDASTMEVISFINWYTFAFLGSGAVAYFIPKCTRLSYQYTIIVPLLLCMSLSIIATSILLCKNVLIKEPVTQNPFTLIYKVVKYALKTKYPRQRSAFTYCEDEYPSRIDFGKSKYGGPFSTEQVEDVKTFFRMLGPVFIIGSVFGFTEEKILKQDLGKALTNQEPNKTISLDECVSSFIFTNTYYITAALLIPVNEIIIYPIFHRCLPNIICYWKVILGILIHLGRYIVLITLVAIAQHRYIKATVGQSANVTATVGVQCLFYEHSAFLNNTIDYRWFSLSEFLSALSFMLIIIGTLESYCAQVPYSMKGLVAGTFFGIFLVFHMFSDALPQLLVILKSVWKPGTIFSCGFWYLQIKLIFLVVTVSMLVVMVKCYKRRKREDVLPNEQIFAERYYDSSSD